MWSAAVLLPALPRRSVAARDSPVLSQNASIGWNPKVFLNVGAACSFSLWQTTIEASRSITRPGRTRPAALAGGNNSPDSSARCAQTTSRAAARACLTWPRAHVQALEQPPARRVRCHRPEQRSLIRQHRHIRDRRRAIGHRDRHVDQDPTRIVTGPRLPQPSESIGELPGQRGPVRDISEQPRPSVRHHTLAVSSCGDRRSGRCSLHLESAPLLVILRLQQSQFPLVAGHFHLSSPGHADQLTKSPG